MSEFSFRLALLFFPGIISAILVEKLVTTQKWSEFSFAIYALVLGLSCYLLYALGLSASTWKWPPQVFLLSTLGNQTSISYEEILIVTGVAPVVAFVITFIVEHHWLNRFAKQLGISNRFGNRDVWSYSFNSADLSDC